MKVFDPDPSLRWLFCVTHPDDEISIAAWIKRLTSSGADVFMSWTHSTPVREAEARGVASVLGVRDENLIFHGATDGSVMNEVPNLLPKFRQMVAEICPDRIACGAFEQGHLDHDATNFLVNHSQSEIRNPMTPSHPGRAAILEIPFYHSYTKRLQTINRFADPSGEEVLELSPMEQQLKLQVAKSYPSENVWSVLLWYEIYRALTMRPVGLRRTERMRVQTHTAFLRPNHQGVMLAKVRRSASWNRWVNAIGPTVLELTSDREALVEHGRSLVR